MEAKTILLVAGQTGAGKDTIVNKIAEKYNLNILVSYTTRPKRVGEGNTHIFIDEKDYDQYASSIVAYTEINGYRYFCTKEQLLSTDIYLIDPKGIKYLTETCAPEEFNFVIVYVDLDYETRRDRVINLRHDDEEVFLSRNNSEDEQFKEFEDSGNWDYYIYNDDLKKSLSYFDNIIHIEGLG